MTTPYSPIHRTDPARVLPQVGQYLCVQKSTVLVMCHVLTSVNEFVHGTHQGSRIATDGVPQ